MVKTSAHRGYDVNGDVSNWSCISESDRGANASASLPATSAGNASSKSMEVEMKEDGHDGRRVGSLKTRRSARRVGHR